MDAPVPRTWRPGEGWLVLLGGSSGLWSTTEAVDRAAIAAMRRAGPVAFLPAAQCPTDYGESFLARYAELGAPGGYIVPVQDATSARDPENARLLEEAALIYIGGGETPALLAAMAASPALGALAAAHDAGAVIVGMSAGAIALAAWGLSIDPGISLLAGWAWAPDLVVAPHYTPARETALRDAVAGRPSTFGLGLPENAALALGPDGEAQVWGTAEIVFAPGGALAER